MDKLLTQNVTSVSEFRNDMAGIVKRAGNKPFAVLNNNKPSFYVLSPAEYERLNELVFDAEIAPLVAERAQSAKTNSVVIELDDL